MSDSEAALDGLNGFPPSAKLVYLVLEHADRPLSPQEIVDRTRLPPRTARDATASLLEAGVIGRHRDPTDARQLQYSVVE
jgi:DNA-binding MarR family transcriptional regulator